MMAPMPEPRNDPAPVAPILLFDGVCNLCHGAVQFILKHERAPTLRFCSLQAPAGRKLLADHGLDPDALDSLVLIVDDAAFLKGAAVVRLTRYLRAPWSWARVFGVVPRCVLDWMYDRVAAMRYRVFGRKDACGLPSGAASARERFLDEA